MSNLTAGSILHNRYRIAHLIGQGGMGAVYEAEDENLGGRVALKRMLPADAKLSHAFKREAQLLRYLHHPRLPRVIDHFTDEAGQFLVMDFIPGDDLVVGHAECDG